VISVLEKIVSSFFLNRFWITLLVKVFNWFSTIHSLIVGVKICIVINRFLRKYNTSLSSVDPFKIAECRGIIPFAKNGVRE